LPIANRATEIIKISREIHVKKSMKEVVAYVKKIPEMPERAVNVFNSIAEKEGSEIEFIAPTYGEIISNYGEQINPLSNKKTFQRGVDLSVEEDENINAIADGEIIEIGQGKLGKTIKVRHNQDIFSVYANCSEIKVKKGQKVKRGESIANIHKPSEKSYAYLHFELWMNGRVVDPTKYISFGRKIL
jgi:murein DD-endopeptidase MepM/ murein hydrolase activator NlpD